MAFRASGASSRGTPTSRRKQARGVETDLRPGDLITYASDRRAADHVAFWLGDGRILHATRRDGVDGVLEEPEPAELRGVPRALVRLGPASEVSAER